MWICFKYFVVLLKQTTEMNTLSIAHVTQSHNSSPAMPQTVSQSRSSNFHFASLSSNNKYFNFFSWYYLSLCQYPYIMLSAHTITTVRTTQS